MPRPTPPALLFDLDGTLIDSIELILGAMRHAFAGFPGHAPTDEEWRAGIGIPLQTALGQYSTDEAELERLFGRYREYQLEHHDVLVKPYEGIVDAIQQFADAGHPMALVTSKSDWMAVKALVLVGLDALIPIVVGCDTCINHKPHPEPVERALALLDATADNALFVGDSPHDVQSGRAAKVYTVGVTWGAFRREEMDASGADVVIDRVSELREVVARFSAPPT
ncbi:MAG: HAD-superfamily hydrolase, subfamily variant 1 [Gemmatimonadetes bacterium]|nr:HAD-superfamily hydrolase, subfamily variant 1 [Gemmatimonadota bacterium]